jgi:HlyD family secretion protein
MYLAAKAQFDFAEKSFQRIKSLYEKNSISRQIYDETEAKYLGAKAQMIAAQQKADMAKEGARSEEIEAAKGNYDRALNALKEVQSYLDETSVKSPVSGEISNIIADPGEVIASGYPLITVTDLSDIWLVIYVTEDKLQNIQMHKEFKVNIPAVSKNDFLFKVAYINPMADFATKKATVETGGTDLKSFEIHLTPVNTIPELRPGMSAYLKLK